MKKLIVLSSLTFLLWGCGSKGDLTPLKPVVAEGEELCCSADSEEEARDIASEYDIEFVSFSNGVATFHTEKDPQEVIDYGTNNGLTPLSLNRVTPLN